MNELTIHLNPELKQPLYEQIYDYIRKEIRQGTLEVEERLPSTRALARYLEVSRSTVELAYEQLLSEGYIEARPCSGFFVASIEGLYQIEPEEQEMPELLNSKVRTYCYDFTPNGIDLGSFPYSVWRKLSREVLSVDNSELFASGESQGEYSLRAEISNYLHQARGVNCSPEQIIIGAGNDYLLMLLSVILGSRKIAFENPTYRQAYRIFKSLGHETETVNLDKSGMKIDELEECGAQIAYVMPSHQYPLGIVMPLRRRLELLEWAKQDKNRYIIEDDYDSEFRYKGKPIPALQGYDRNAKVIYLGTFSKSIAPAIRMGYLVLPKELLAVYREKSRFLNCTVPRIEQKVVEHFLEKGYFERHLNKMRALYRGRHDKLLECLKPMEQICQVSGEHAGVHLLLTFDDRWTEEELLQTAAEQDIKVYGLSEYYTRPWEMGGTTILLGYANMSEEQIHEATEILVRIWKKEERM